MLAYIVSCKNAVEKLQRTDGDEKGHKGIKLTCVTKTKQPFNAFLSGFSATVGQFVLTASLRIQTAEANKSDFPSVSPERYVLRYSSSGLDFRI